MVLEPHVSVAENGFLLGTADSVEPGERQSPGSDGSMCLMTCAGMQPTTVLSGTFFVTTAFAPIVTAGITVTAAPSRAPFLMAMGAQYVERRVEGTSGWLIVIRWG